MKEIGEKLRDAREKMEITELFILSSKKEIINLFFYGII